MKQKALPTTTSTQSQKNMTQRLLVNGVHEHRPETKQQHLSEQPALRRTIALEGKGLGDGNQRVAREKDRVSALGVYRGRAEGTNCGQPGATLGTAAQTHPEPARSRWRQRDRDGDAAPALTWPARAGESGKAMP